MFLSSPLLSPLAEKRIILFTVKKQMIGRRAYSDSIYNKTKPTVIGRYEEQQSSSPRYMPTQAEIHYKTLTVGAC